MNILRRIYASFFLSLIIVSSINLHAMPSQQKTIDKENFESVTPVAMQHFCAIKAIGNLLWNLIDAELAKPKETRCFAYVEDGRTKYPLPSHWRNQTEQGLFLLIDDEMPVELWTPWGKVSLIAGGEYREGWQTTWKLIVTKLLSSVSAKLYQRDNLFLLWNEERFRDVYKILAVGGVSLPAPVLREASNEVDGSWIKEAVVKEVWTKMETKYTGKKIF